MAKYLICPKCGGIFYVYVLASNPPQYEGECKRGDFMLRYYERKDSFLPITEEELNEHAGIENKFVNRR